MRQQLHVKQTRPIKSTYIRKSIAILTMGTAMLFCSCANKIEKIKEFSSGENFHPMESEGFEMLYSDSAIVRFKLQAPKLISYDEEKDPFTEFPEGIDLEQYDENMNIVTKITANYAQYFENDEKWIAKNNVIVVNPQGDSLKTEELVWEEGNEKLYSEQFVEIVRKDQIITGIGFESDQDMNNWEIKNVKGQIYLEVTE